MQGMAERRGFCLSCEAPSPMGVEVAQEPALAEVVDAMTSMSLIVASSLVPCR